MKSLRMYDTAAHEVQESVPKSVGTDKVKIWVEGNDWRLYSRFFNLSLVEKEGRTGGFSSHSAVDSYKEYKKQFPNKLAIVIRDADFKRANGDNLDAEVDIFYADCHDHEMMCVYQDNVRNSLINNFECDETSESFFGKIFDELKSLSFLKWYNYNNACGYNFTTLNDLYGLNESDFKNSASLENKVYVRTSSEHAKKGITKKLNRIDLETFNLFVASHLNVDKYDLTNGHDFYNRINYHLQKISKKNTRSEDQLKDTIYTAFEFVFSQTNLYKMLDSWCKNNKKYILKVY